jgi:hypothetical protein
LQVVIVPLTRGPSAAGTTTREGVSVEEGGSVEGTLAGGKGSDSAGVEEEGGASGVVEVSGGEVVEGGSSDGASGVCGVLGVGAIVGVQDRTAWSGILVRIEVTRQSE